MNKILLEEKSVESEDAFEGEETLGAELRENLSLPESDMTSVYPDVYPDAIVNIVPESASVFQLKRKLDKKTTPN